MAAGSSKRRPRSPSKSRSPAGKSPSGEFALLAKLRAALGREGRGVLVGIGDDCAVVDAALLTRRRGKGVLLTTDSMVEGVHFRREWLTPRELGRRALRAAVSDISAMGGRPRWVLLSLEVPRGHDEVDETDLLALIRSVAADAKRAGAALAGGNLSGGDALSLAVTVIGEAAGRPLLRSGAKAGDLVFVTGALGGAAAGWRALAACSASAPRGRRAAALADARRASSAYRLPPLRSAFAAAIGESGLAHSMIDVSDGLAQDLGHLARESRVAIRLDLDSVPVHAAAKRFAQSAASARELALCGGEDYELAFTAAASAWPSIEKLAARNGTPIMPVGIVDKGRPAVTDSDGRPLPILQGGFDHLRSSRSPSLRGLRSRAGRKTKRA